MSESPRSFENRAGCNEVFVPAVFRLAVKSYSDFTATAVKKIWWLGVYLTICLHLCNDAVSL